MSKSCRAGVVALLCFLFLPMALLAATPVPTTRIATNAASCAAKNQNLRVTARVDGAPKNVRLYFHAIGPTCGEYYVDMHRDANTPGQYWAVLPIAGPDVSAIAAQVKADFGAGAYLPGDSVVVPVTSDCPPATLSPEETRAASNIVLGLTQANQSSIPCAFRCKGITSFLTTTNELHPNEQCLRLLAAEGNRPPWYKTGAAAAGAAGLLGGAYALTTSSKSHPPAPSRARP